MKFTRIEVKQLYISLSKDYFESNEGHVTLQLSCL